MKKHVLAASFLLSAMTAIGAGYQLNLEGLRQLAMGGTGTAWPWDASTIYYNPGGLARLKGIQVYASAMLVMPSTAYGNQQFAGNTPTPPGYRTVPQTFMPFSVYIGGPVQQGSKFAVGLGIYTPAGIGLKWDDNWLGKYIVQSIQLQSVFFQPTFSYRCNEFLSVGGGFIYAIGSLDMKQALPVHSTQGPNEDDGQATLHGNATGAGFNLGVQLKPYDNFQIGFTYRSQVNMSIGGGTANFSVPQSLATSFPNTQFDSQLPLPQVASVGVGWRTGDLTLQLDFNYTGWNSFDSLRINFAEHTSSLADIHAPRHYRNTLTSRLGGCYKLGKVVSVMAGAAYDPTPVTNGFVSPDLPDADRIILSCGISVKPLRGFTILAAIEATDAVKRNGSYDYGNFSGTYKTEAATPGIGIYYNF